MELLMDYLYSLRCLRGKEHLKMNQKALQHYEFLNSGDNPLIFCQLICSLIIIDPNIKNTLTKLL